MPLGIVCSSYGSIAGVVPIRQTKREFIALLFRAIRVIYLISIRRGFIASGTIRSRSIYSSPFSRLAPFT
ncbi:Hypothetical protein Y17_4685 [Pectobacterium wasabiae CFBP 3304]|nr:Hypothetical protein Y17_4685 [Pectobacterium wasabiae CFBP 3304]